MLLYWKAVTAITLQLTGREVPPVASHCCRPALYPQAYVSLRDRKDQEKRKWLKSHYICFACAWAEHCKLNHTFFTPETNNNTPPGDFNKYFKSLRQPQLFKTLYNSKQSDVSEKLNYKVSVLHYPEQLLMNLLAIIWVWWVTKLSP